MGEEALGKLRGSTVWTEGVNETVDSQLDGAAAPVAGLVYDAGPLE